MRKPYLMLLFLFVNFNAFAECVNFKVYNNTKSVLFLKNANQSKVEFCKFLPLILNKGSSADFSVKEPEFSGETIFYISFKNQSYDLFEEFSVDAVGSRELNEELIGKDSAYSWNSNSSKVYLCSAADYKKHQTCSFS